MDCSRYALDYWSDHNECGFGYIIFIRTYVSPQMSKKEGSLRALRSSLVSSSFVGVLGLFNLLIFAFLWLGGSATLIHRWGAEQALVLLLRRTIGCST